MIPASLADAAILVLNATEAEDKCRLTRRFAAAWAEGNLSLEPGAAPPVRPARPARPQLMAPKCMPRRSYGGEAGRIALVHALAHIELNAVDLAWDIVARFPGEAMPPAFYDDWVNVALDEAQHFDLLQGLLAKMGRAYGDLPAHDGLWEAAMKTADDLMARLAVVPMALEARGLDSTPATIFKLERTGDKETPPVLAIILADEIRHVAAGLRWFAFLAERRGLDPAETFARLLGERLGAGLKPPFNHQARAEAGFPKAWYEPLARGIG